MARKVDPKVDRKVGQRGGPMVDHSEALMVALMEGRSEGLLGQEMSWLLLMWFQRVMPPRVVLQE